MKEFGDQGKKKKKENYCSTCTLFKFYSIPVPFPNFNCLHRAYHYPKLYIFIYVSFICQSSVYLLSDPSSALPLQHIWSQDPSPKTRRRAEPGVSPPFSFGLSCPSSPCFWVRPRAFPLCSQFCWAAWLPGSCNPVLLRLPSPRARWLAALGTAIWLLRHPSLTSQLSPHFGGRNLLQPPHLKIGIIIMADQSCCED